MAVTTLTSQIKELAKFPNQPIVADSLDLAFTAPSVAADGIEFGVSGREIVIIQNTDVGAQTFTIASGRTVYGHVQNLTAYSLAAGEFAVLFPGALELYRTANGTLLITMSNVAVKVAVIRVPHIIA